MSLHETFDRVRKLLPGAPVRVEDGRLVVSVHPATLTPSQLAALAACRIEEPPPPRPDKPLLSPRPPRPPARNRSTVPQPHAVCREIFERYLEERRADDRKGFMKEAKAAGVAQETASRFFRDARRAAGLSPSVRASHARTRKRRDGATPDMTDASRVRNGIPEPVPGSVRREVWDMADLLWKALGRSPDWKELQRRLAHVNRHSVKKALYRWRRFHGIETKG